jgi:ABC-type multidrug transport system fused ATPase/permease subunit
VHIPLREYSALLRTYLWPLRRKVGLLAVLMFTSIGLQVANPQVIRYFIDTARSGGAISGLLVAALVFLAAAVAYQALTVAATYVGEDIGWSATNALRADLALHCLRLDMAFHNERTPGQMIERIDGDVADLAIFFAALVIRVLGSLLLLAGILFVLVFQDWRISLALAVYAGLSLTLLFRLREVAAPYWTAAREVSAQFFGFIEEHLAGTEDIRSSGAENHVLRDLYRLGRDRLRAERRAGNVSIVMVFLSFGLLMLGQVVAFATGFWLVRAGVLTLGAAFIILYYTEALFRPLRDLTREMENLQKAAGSLVRIRELYQTHDQLPDGAGRALPGGPLSVTFEAVSFRYGDRGLVLQDVSFALEPGRVLGLLGRTGSGKTTLTRLLIRLYDPASGAIHLGRDGHCVDVRDARMAELRQRVGVVTQDVQLFRASVRDNLTFFDDRIPDDRILNVIHDLGLAAWYHALPRGLDTELQTSGQGLSAGEAQLLAFTRVFLKDPGLVILDEASSRLDPATEQLIERAVDRLLAGRTGLIIAHRLATVHRADQIMILEAGRVREYGDYARLAADPASRFYGLLQAGLDATGMLA